MIEDILKNVESPFTDEMICELIKKYVLSKCDNNGFYDSINNYDKKTEIKPEMLANLNSIEKNGVDISDALFMEKDEIPYITDNNNAWLIVKSEEDPFSENIRGKDRKVPIVYRAYLNIKGTDKFNFIRNYISLCKKNNVPFKFKLSKTEDRDDQIIILSTEDILEKNIEMIETLSQGLELGKIPKLIGSYKGNIGIAEEYYNRLYSPTTAKLGLIRSSIKKYLCDNYDRFSDKLSDEEKKLVDEMIYYFTETYELEKKRSDKLGEEYVDSRKSYYQKKNRIECAKEYIENDSESYICKSELSKLSSLIEKLYLENPESFIEEVKENFKMIGREVWGFSKDFIFLNQTEEKYLSKKTISVDEIADFIEKEQIIPQEHYSFGISKKEDKSRED